MLEQKVILTFSIKILVPKFPSTINVNVSREKIKQTANLMKIALEKSSSIPELNEILTKLISQIKS